MDMSPEQFRGAIPLQKYSLTSIRNTGVYGIKTTKITVKRRTTEGRGSTVGDAAKNQTTTH